MFSFTWPVASSENYYKPMKSANETKKQRLLPCPTCKKMVIWNEKAKWRPFCSERCRLIDLGEWVSEGHRIPGEDGSAPNQLDGFEPED